MQISQPLTTVNICCAIKKATQSAENEGNDQRVIATNCNKKPVGNGSE